MKTVTLAVSITLMALGLSGCPVKPDPKENDNYLVITGNKFRKPGSINTKILFAGVKRKRGPNRFDPKFLPVLEREITTPQVTQAFNKQTGKVAFKAATKAGIKVADGDIAVDSSNEYRLTGNYSVFTLFDVYDFVDELNSAKNRKRMEALMRYDDPRIITSVAVVFGRESSRKVSTSGNVSLKIKNLKIGNPKFSIKAETSGETVARLSDGTVFAYEYARICWEKRNGRIQVATLEVDRPGIDNNCPSGTKDNASKL
ncbi:hypothetical protein [Candidatus Thiosymbion oneisti]|uniref:hypothetical protein n=1 Tax=Candidatus Thiosymbion oneisti TaxID=589554 RepID=UPI00114C9C8E|nr:hypothetical protein [Candidatus Thiosymbion oneisti]